jgi:hypothetical protein
MDDGETNPAIRFKDSKKGMMERIITNNQFAIMNTKRFNN